MSAPPLATQPGALERRLVSFGRALREHGIGAGPSEVVDAAAAMTALGLAERERLREGLAATLLRRSGQRDVFDDVFDVYFPAAVGQRASVADGSATQRPSTLDDRRAVAEELRRELARALAAGDEAALAALAARVVELLGALANEATTGSFSAQQALDALAPQTAIADAEALLLGAGAAGAGGTPGAGGAGAGGFGNRLTRDELRAAVAAFRRRVEVETRRRNAEQRGPERISRYAIRPSADQTPFVLAGATEIEELRRTIAPLARKLATRLASRRRQAARGTIDIRRTLRTSLSTGGIPMQPVLAHRRPARPDLVVLADLSSSVAGFSRFTILLLQAMAAQFRRIRIFGFVNIVADLTDEITGAAPGADLTRSFDDLSRMTRYHRNSDYGSVFRDVTEHHLDAIGPRTIVLILGDARTNGTNPAVSLLAEIAGRARHTVWLNPEPARTWGQGDSVAHRYAEVVDMHECRNVGQLRLFVTRLLPV